jgi:tetratricopeptide (TPR) repeat protein
VDPPGLFAWRIFFAGGNIAAMNLRSRVVFLAVTFAGCGFALPALAQTSSQDAIGQFSDQGQRALAEGRYSDAEKAFEKLRELEPHVAEVHANLGAIYFQERKFQQAVGALQEALKLKPGLSKTKTLLAISLSETGRYQEAAAGLEKGFADSSDTATRRMCGLQLERVYSGLQRDADAVAVALQLNRLYPNDAEVLYHSGRIFGNYAYLSAKRLGEVAPTSIWTRLASGEALESQGSYDGAIREYRQVLALDPHRPGIHYRVGRVLLARAKAAGSVDDTPAALKEFSTELELDPTNANAAYELGEAAHTSGNMAEAERHFRQALKYYPDFEQANLGLAATLMNQGKPELARALIQKAIEVDPEDEVAWFRLSQVDRTLGNKIGQQKASAEFLRLRQKSNEIDASKGMYGQTDVTKQKVDGPPEP